MEMLDTSSKLLSPVIRDGAFILFNDGIEIYVYSDRQTGITVDTATDNLIQQTLKQHFTDSTMIVIAHRITSVIDGHMVVLLSSGLVQECDSPSKLLENKSSSFSKLVAEYANLLKQNVVQPDRQELCREVEKRFTPYIGQEFGDVEDAVTFYKIYTIACGFDVRRYTTKKWRGGEIKLKLVVCNREGFAHKKPSKEQDDGLVGEKSQRIFRVTRVGCKARIRLYMKNGLLLIDRFHEGHNHELISLKDREFQKLSRNITDYHKMIIVSNSRLKIGATKTYRICKEQVNGYENIGASLNDFKNFHRDVKCFIHERDGQLFVDHFKETTETRIGFYFDYDLDNDGSLRRAIWADGTARDNYKIFGDAVSFDPTYSTNKYSMVFTPFTGVDHHKRSVTFCGALIAREDYESFNWVFNRFLQAMGVRNPST
ncbi:protein FAR1-RELATED SEQUENCE 5-like [Silene latifolia]|uniref:protein FAR1-RELATED SEQUENCE 5-like n=1 Tax=Silene latifolia TaxID=37657 RepID=UPI003D78336D